MQARNPIIPGFNPDPSICRVGKQFFLVCSSFQFFPGLPIYRSSDLANWKQIGNAINRVNQIDLSKVKTIIQHYDNSKEKDEVEKPFIYSWGLCAPTLRYHSKKKKFFLVCTLVNPMTGSTGKEYINFLITTDDITRESAWSDPIYFDFHGIDPDIYFHQENDDIAYITGSYTYFPIPKDNADHARTSIVQFQLDLSTGKKLTNEKVIWKGWEGCMVVPEGPHIYQKNGYYYLLVSDGGTFIHHMLTISRSRNIDGPYTSYEKNPIFTHDPTGKYTKCITADFKGNLGQKLLYFQNCGHADFISFTDINTGSEVWFAVLLAVRAKQNGKVFPMGRETVLVEFQWDSEADSWPKFNNFVNETFDINFEIYDDNQYTTSNNSLVFSQSTDMFKYLFIKNPNMFNYKFDPNNSSNIKIKGSNIELNAEAPGASFISVRQTQYTQIASVSVHIFSDCNSRFRAGLCLFKDKFRVVKIGYNSKSKKIYYSCNIPSRHEANLTAENIGVDDKISKIDFKICSTQMDYSFFYRMNDLENFKLLGKVGTVELTAWDFTGTLFGLYNIGNSDFISFENFKVC